MEYEAVLGEISGMPYLKIPGGYINLFTGNPLGTKSCNRITIHSILRSRPYTEGLQDLFKYFHPHSLIEDKHRLLISFHIRNFLEELVECTNGH